MYRRYPSDYSRENLLSASKSYKKVMNKYINKHIKQQHNKLRRMQNSYPKAYWIYLNSLKGRRATDSPPLDDFYRHFSHIYTSDQSQDELNIGNINFNNENDILNRPITAEEIGKCIAKLKNAKSCGFDEIINEYIKVSKAQMLPIYVGLFNLILNTGIIPEIWSQGKIMPIYKNNGDSTNPDNYRPISTLSCLGKLFTALLSERLSTFIEENAILKENQAGFRKHYSTTDHIFALYSLIEILKHEKKKLFCSFIDLSKAFDSVWRIGLWRKLLNNSIDGKFLKVIYNMYLNIKACVSVDGANSAFFFCNTGVRQGDNLSPVLFALFMNDLEDKLLIDNVDGIRVDLTAGDQSMYYFKIFVLLYADDTVILADNAEAFQKSLDSFDSYCTEWKLKINQNKSKVIVFGAQNTDEFRFKIGDTTLEIVDSYKYLGTYFSKSRSFLNARKHVVAQAKKAMHLLNMRIHNLNLPIDLQLKLFDNTILPILTYSCEIWGFKNCEMLEVVHNQFLRSTLKLRKSTPLYMLYGELGRLPILHTIKYRMINYWYRILTGKQSKLSYMFYQKLNSTPGLNSKWIQKIKQILEECGRPDIWDRQSPNSATCVIVKRSLRDQFIQEWSAKLQESSKGMNYSLYKENIDMENYLMVLPKSIYTTFAKFRTGNHRFPCEVGRYNDTEIAERKCTLCDSGDVGDEMHYLLLCPFFSNDRSLYLSRYYYARPNILKFKEIMSTRNMRRLKRLCIFIAIILKTVGNVSTIT